MAEGCACHCYLASQRSASAGSPPNNFWSGCAPRSPSESPLCVSADDDDLVSDSCQPRYAQAPRFACRHLPIYCHVVLLCFVLRVSVYSLPWLAVGVSQPPGAKRFNRNWIVGCFCIKVCRLCRFSGARLPPRPSACAACHRGRALLVFSGL